MQEALSASRDAWAAADDEFPLDDPDLKAEALLALDTAIQELEQAVRLTAVRETE